MNRRASCWPPPAPCCPWAGRAARAWPGARLSRWSCRSRRRRHGRHGALLPALPAAAPPGATFVVINARAPAGRSARRRGQRGAGRPHDRRGRLPGPGQHAIERRVALAAGGAGPTWRTSSTILRPVRAADLAPARPGDMSPPEGRARATHHGTAGIVATTTSRRCSSRGPPPCGSRTILQRTTQLLPRCSRDSSTSAPQRQRGLAAAAGGAPPVPGLAPRSARSGAGVPTTVRGRRRARQTPAAASSRRPDFRVHPGPALAAFAGLRIRLGQAAERLCAAAAAAGRRRLPRHGPRRRRGPEGALGAAAVEGLSHPARRPGHCGSVRDISDTLNRTRTTPNATDTPEGHRP